jgi:hypothetical protein
MKSPKMYIVALLVGARDSMRRDEGGECERKRMSWHWDLHRPSHIYTFK